MKELKDSEFDILYIEISELTKENKELLPNYDSYEKEYQEIKELEKDLNLQNVYTYLPYTKLRDKINELRYLKELNSNKHFENDMLIALSKLANYTGAGLDILLKDININDCREGYTAYSSIMCDVLGYTEGVPKDITLISLALTAVSERRNQITISGDELTKLWSEVKSIKDIKDNCSDAQRIIFGTLMFNNRNEDIKYLDYLEKYK